MKTIKSINELSVAIDLGANGPKILACYQNKTHFLYLEPEVYLAPKHSIVSALDLGTQYGDEEFALGDKNIWIEDGDDCYAFGSLARALNPYINKTKGQKAQVVTPKVQAVLGYLIKEVLKISDDQSISLNLWFLLPITESGQVDVFKTTLGDSLLYYKYKDQPIEIDLKSLEIRPESTGLLSFREVLKVKDIEGTLMIACAGHRDINLFAWHQATRTHTGHSRNIGFYDYAEQVAAVAGIEHPRDIIQYLRTWDLQAEDFLELFKDYSEHLRTAKCDSILNSVKKVGGLRDQYVDKFIRFIKEVAPRDLSTIVMTGGAAQYLSTGVEEVSERRLEGVRVVSDSGAYATANKLIGLKNLQKYGLHPTQVVDLCGIYQVMMKKLES